MWQAYRDDGVVVWGIASRESDEAVRAFVERLGITFPVLLDRDGNVNREYALEMAFPTAAYPQDWVIGTDGTIVYGSNSFELDAIEAAIDGELAAD